ncbi:MAG TPA: aminopeptidase P family protein [Ktedonobacteraceae bacterium]|jgi:Xaa-Pro aminopeptidase|nr:aminopeptidase P family protein [Ktedonobacteraceae bacterium]
MNTQALTSLRTWLNEQGLDAYLVTQAQNRSYLSGWLNDDVEGAGMLLVGRDAQILLTNPLYQEVASQEASGWQVVVPEGREYAPSIADLAREHGWKTLGFESSAITYSDFEKIAGAGKDIFTLRPYEHSYVETLRQIKQPYEVELLKKAIAITDETFAHICEWIQPGMTEKEVAWEIHRYMVELGADGLAFETIVASGPHGSMPHAHPSQRRIERGELITIDMGARYHGYCADMTRTICLGEPSEPRMLEIYNIVLQAMKTCEAGLHGGISGKAADALARDVLNEAGFGEYYIHSTGHGVGLQIHEGPVLSARAPDDVVLAAGTVVTVEPGVYIPGWSGARIEDCVLVREQGCEVLTQSPTTLVIPR